MNYYFSKTIASGFDTAVEKTTQALKKEGFGILTEIDIKATLKKKLDVDFKKYTILGACNPPYAHKALLAEDKIGDITNPSKMNKFIQKAEKLGVKLVACGFSLKKFKIDTTKVPKEMKTVDNGILYNFQLQKKGYKSISL